MSFFFRSRSASKPPRLVVPKEVFVNIGKSVGVEVNQALEYIQDVALGGNLKQFLIVSSVVPLSFRVLSLYVCDMMSLIVVLFFCYCCAQQGSWLSNILCLYVSYLEHGADGRRNMA